MQSIQIGDVVGDYRVIEMAGSGGMGTVYKIEHVITKRIEAIKILAPGSSTDPDQVLRFEREIQVQARLHHPNIVALYNAIREGNSIALVMEYVEGESLQRILEAGPLPVETAVDFTCQVLGALAYAHGEGVIHRDVAPANIIVTPNRVVKLTDFGLARGTTDLRLSTSGSPLGSPWYMSPEQVKGSGVLDARTDLYAMGAVLYEMLTGAKLFQADGAFEVMRAHVEMDPAPPSSRNPLVPAALDAVVRRALAKDPAMRFGSADEFWLALRAAVPAPRPVAVAPPSPPQAKRAGFAELTAQLRAFHPSRAAILMALVPAALLAGLCTIRLFPSAARAQATDNKASEAATSKVETPPTPPPAAAPVEPDPTTPDTAANAENPPAGTRPRSHSAAGGARPAKPPERSYAIRVTGGEAPAETRVPVVTLPAAPRSIESTGPCIDKPEPVAEPPEAAGRLAAAPAAPAPATASPEATPAKAQPTGNRFVHALGKVNPFRKSKSDTAQPAKPPANQE
jgi:serine/threonine-protein kinase